MAHGSGPNQESTQTPGQTSACISTTIPKRSTTTLGHIRVQDQILIIGLPCVMTEAKLGIQKTLNYWKLEVFLAISHGYLA